MRRSATTAIALALATILALLTALSVGNAHPARQSNPTTPPPPPLNGTPVISTPIPTPGGPALRSLTKKQRTTIVHIAETDRTLQKLVAKKPYQVTNVAMWLTKSGRLLGGVVTIRLKRAAKISGTWLDVAYDCSEQTSPPDTRVPYKATYTNVRYITISVDLKRKKVIGITPLGMLVGTAHYPAGYKRPVAC